MISPVSAFAVFAKACAIPLCGLALLSMAACGSPTHNSHPLLGPHEPKGNAQADPSSASATSDSAMQRTLAAGDAACHELNLQVATTPLRKGTREEVLRIVPENIARERAALRRLVALEPPAPLRARWQQMLAVRQALIEQLVAFLGAAQRDDLKTSHALSASKRALHERLKTTSERVGLHECAKLG